VFRELSARDKGAARPLREKLDEIKRAKGQEAIAAEWADKARGLLALPRLNIADALAWQRSQDHQVAALDTPEAVLAFRALATLLDEVETIAEQDGGPMMLTHDQVALLAEAAARYVAARHSDEHLPQAESERIERLRALIGPLFERVSQMAGACEQLGPC